MNDESTLTLSSKYFVMNRPFLALLLSILPFPVTFADPRAMEPLTIIDNSSCKPITIHNAQNESEKYCMSRIDQQIFKIDHTHEKKVSLFAGDNLTTDHHSATGYIGFSSREYDPKSPKELLHETYLNIPIGSFGKAPTTFSQHEIGKNSVGYILETATNYQGIESGGIHIIAENSGKAFHQYIPTFADDFGYHGDETIAETITYTISVQAHNSSEAIYPLQITLNGKYEGVEYIQEKFIWIFDEKTQSYIKPTHYPALI